MPFNVHITAHERHRIVILREEGLSVADIAREMGVARNTVYLWIRRWDNEGNVDEIKKTGRPRRTSRPQDVNIIRQFRESPFLQTRNVAIANNVSLSTVRRRLHEAGIHCRKPARKLKLTARHKLQRLQFAERYLNFDFSNVIFADEKTFKSSQHGRITL